MTQDCSHPSSTADVNPCQSKSLPKGINIIEADENSAPRVEVVSKSEEEAPWGYIFIRHYLVESFEKKLKTLRAEGKHVPNSFIHRTTDYKRKPNGKGVMKTEKPTISGLVFLQGETEQLTSFLEDYFPSYHLVNNCSTKVPASIKHSIMKPFMRVMETEPERVTFLRDPFLKFARITSNSESSPVPSKVRKATSSASSVIAISSWISAATLSPSVTSTMKTSKWRNNPPHRIYINVR